MIRRVLFLLHSGHVSDESNVEKTDACPVEKKKRSPNQEKARTRQFCVLVGESRSLCRVMASYIASTDPSGSRYQYCVFGLGMVVVVEKLKLK